MLVLYQQVIKYNVLFLIFNETSIGIIDLSNIFLFSRF